MTEHRRISKTVGLCCSEIAKMSADWNLIDALLGGTPVMREQCSTWLPRFPKESYKAWRIRVGRSVLYPAFEDAIDNLTDKPFSHMTGIEGELPAVIESLRTNCDGAGTSLHAFSEDVYKAALTFGAVYGMADMPGIDDGDDSSGIKKERTQEDELNETPYFTYINAQDMLGWKTRLTSNGIVLAQVRFIERRTEDHSDAYADHCVDYVRVITEKSWELWKESGSSSKRAKEWVLIKEGNHRFGRVPIRVLRFGKKVGHMGALPPMRHLAWINLSHYQDSADQENILSFARVPLLHYAGGDEPNPEDPDGYGAVIIGPNQVVRSRNADAKLEKVPYTGTEIKLGSESLRTKEQRMEVLGLKPLIEKKSDKTAMGSKIDADDNDNSAKTWVRRTEEFILNLLSDAAEWKGEELANDVAVDIFDDFGVSGRPSSELNIIQRDRERNELSHQTYVAELVRRGVYSPTVNSATELKNLESEIPTIEGLGGEEDDDSEISTDSE